MVATTLISVWCVLPIYALADEGTTPGLPGYPDAVVRYEDGRLTVHTTDVPVRDVLEELGAQSGASMDLRALQDRLVTHRFVALPLDDALHHLLEKQNFVAHYTVVRDEGGEPSDTRLSKLEVVGPAGEDVVPKMRTPPARNGPPLPGVQTKAAQDAIEQYGGVLYRNQEISLEDEEALAGALGSRANISQVLGAAFQHEDAAVRAGAARTVARVFEADGGMRSLGGSGADAEQMAAAVRAVAGPRAEGFMRTMSESLDDPALRAQAEDILAALQRR